MPVRPESADDAGGHGVLQTEGIPDRNHVIAHLEMRGITERHGDQIRLLGLKHGNVRALVRTDDLRRKRAVVEERHRDFVGVLDHVEIGDDVAVLGVDDHAGARALKRPLMRLRIRRNVEELAEEGIVQQRIALSRLLLDGAARRDVDHRRRHPLDHGGERGHRRGIACRGAAGSPRRTPGKRTARELSTAAASPKRRFMRDPLFRFVGPAT